MAIVLENLIDLNLLSYYDEKIKKWLIANSNKQIIFTTKDNLPKEGQVDILYVTEQSIFIWDGTKYVSMEGTGSSSGSIAWGHF